ncbi:MAG: YaiO family outer membrane beta-barrel protein [Panacagrimonas sp.]
MFLLPSLAWTASIEDGLRLKREQKLVEAETVFAELVGKNPADAAALAELATVQGWQGRHAEAAGTWRLALKVQLESADLRIGLARVLYWSGRREEALSELGKVLERNADHYDALLLRGDVLMAQNDRAGARAAYERARDIQPGNDDRDLSILLARTETPPRSRIDTGYAHERYNNARGTESGSHVQAGTSLAPGLSAYLRWDRLDQFGSIDNQYLAGAYWTPALHWLVFAEAGGTPDADFLPRVQAQTVVEWLPEGPVQPLLGYRYFGYVFGEVHTLTPGLRLPRLGFGELELRYALSRNTDESNTGVASVRYGWTRGRFAPYLAIHDGDEALPPQAEANFTSYGAGCVMNLDRNWSARLDYAYENRPDFYIHHTAALGLTYRF